MIQSSIPQNQLKFNLDAVTNNLNLVNIVHNPQPISILKDSKVVSRDADRNVNNMKSSFEYIDEEKLSMYAFLVKRDIKTKEWLGKYDQHDHEQLNEAMASFNKTPKDHSVPNNTQHSNVIPNKKITNDKPKAVANDTAKKNLVNAGLNVKTDHGDINKCCHDSVASIEFLQKQLSEFKYERLKVVFNDPAEEEKQRRIQMEQIKYLSRSMYNLQNQMSRFSSMYTKEATAQKKADVLKRIVHTMRQVVKTMQVFAEAYPYRPDDGQITEKLCAHFYKQLHSSVTNFSNCVDELAKNSNKLLDLQSSNVTDKLTTLLLSCNKYFIEEPNNAPKQPAASKQQKPQQQEHQQATKKPLKVIRTSRLPGNFKKPITSVIKKTTKPLKKPTIVRNKNLVQKAQAAAFNIEFSPPKKQQPKSLEAKSLENKAYEQKTIKTARLFPSKLPPPKSNFQTRSRSQSAERILSKNSLNTSNQSLNETSQSRHSVLSDSFKHLSSPTVSTLKKIGRSRYNSNENFKITKPRSFSNPSLNRSSQSPNRSNRSLNSIILSPTKYNSFQRNLSMDTMNQSLTNLRSKYEYEPNMAGKTSSQSQFLFNFNESYEKPKYLRMRSPTKPILKHDYQQRSHSPYQKGFRSTNDILSRLDSIQKESNVLRRKYEGINYEETLTQANKPRRPYEECYLADAATVQEQYETKVTYEDTFLELNPPSDGQLQRVLTYAKNFADYSQKTSVTKIGESKFDDFELFEYLSNELFNENFSSVFTELEQINQEFTSNLIANEFVDSSCHAENMSSSSEFGA